MFLNPNKAETGTKIIVLRGELLDENELKLALQFNERQRAALAQIIEAERIDRMDAANDCALANNELAMSFNNGGHYALTMLLKQIEDQQLPST